MQIKKEEIENAIITAAEAEFLEKGYKNASLRSISKRSSVSLSNIYNYFSSKDKLFQKILQPVLGSISKAKSFLKNHSESETAHSMDFHLQFMEPAVDFIDKNRELLKLLMLNSYGSVYENFFDELTEWYTDLSINTLDKLCRKNRTETVRINRFVAHNLVAFWIQFLREALMHDIKKDDLLVYARDLMSFTYNGWCGLMDEKKL